MSTPGADSDRSIYFDAPIMQINTDDTKTRTDNPEQRSATVPDTQASSTANNTQTDAGYVTDGGSAFTNGAATTGPRAAATADADDSVNLRTASADSALSPKQRSRIRKDEAKQSKLFSRIIKREAKVEKVALDVAIKELSELQRVQKDAVKAESKVHTAHAAALRQAHTHESALLAARTTHESSQAQLASRTAELETVRARARAATEGVAEKAREVEQLRVMHAVDERERGVKMGVLSGKENGK